MPRRRMKTRKWYSTSIQPDRAYNLIVMTDMGYIFEAVWKENKFLTSVVRNGKVYFEEDMKHESIIKWMKV